MCPGSWRDHLGSEDLQGKPLLADTKDSVQAVLPLFRRVSPDHVPDIADVSTQIQQAGPLQRHLSGRKESQQSPGQPRRVHQGEGRAIWRSSGCMSSWSSVGRYLCDLGGGGWRGMACLFGTIAISPLGGGYFPIQTPA